MIEKIEVKYMKSRQNLYHVPMRQWGRWCNDARQVFNEVYSSMAKNQELFLHPKQEKITKSRWKTTAWNAAWTAAGACQNVSSAPSVDMLPKRSERK